MPKLPAEDARKRHFRKRAILTAYKLPIAYGALPSIKAAAAAAKVDIKDHYRWLKEDPNYRKSWDEVQEQAAQSVEDEAVRRAMEGVKRVVLYRGKPVRTGRGRSSRILYETTYSDQLLLALLKRFRPQLYRDHVMTEHSGSVEIIDRLQSARARLIEMSKNDLSDPDRAAG